MTAGMCPQCGNVYECGELTPVHRADGEVCVGSAQIPRCAMSDGRRLWNGQPNMLFRGHAK